MFYKLQSLITYTLPSQPRKFNFDLKPPREARSDTTLFRRRQQQQHATLPQPLPQEQQPLLNPDGTEQSPKSGSSPSSPSFRDTLPVNGISSPRKYSADDVSRPPVLPPRPPSMSQSSPSNGPSSLSRQSISSPVIGGNGSSNGSAPPIPQRLPVIPKREPLSTSLSNSALPVVPRKPTTPQRKNFNDGPPLPPREVTPTRSPLTTMPPRNDGPPLPPRNEGTPTTPQRFLYNDSPTVPPRNDGPLLPPRERVTPPSRNPLRTRDSKPQMNSGPPLPPRGS